MYAIPGDISNSNSYGTNELIKEGAIPVTEIEDFYVKNIDIFYIIYTIYGDLLGYFD